MKTVPDHHGLGYPVKGSLHDPTQVSPSEDGALVSDWTVCCGRPGHGLVGQKYPSPCVYVTPLGRSREDWPWTGRCDHSVGVFRGRQASGPCSQGERKYP